MREFIYDSLGYSDFYNDALRKWDYHSYKCFVKSNPLGYLCGYVALPYGHPLQGCGDDTLSDIDVHGGLTFADDVVKGVMHSCWVLGFDCAHSGDIPFAMSPDAGRIFDADELGRGHAWNCEEVAAECERLVEQIEGIVKTSVLLGPLCNLVTTHCARDSDFGLVEVEGTIAGLTLDPGFAKGLMDELGKDAMPFVPEGVPALAWEWTEWELDADAMRRLKDTAAIWESKGFGSLGVVFDAGQHFIRGDLLVTCSHWAETLGISAMLDAYAHDVPIDDVIA